MLKNDEQPFIFGEYFRFRVGNVSSEYMERVLIIITDNFYNMLFKIRLPCNIKTNQLFFIISLNLVLESTIPFAKKYHNCCDLRAMYNSPAVDTVDSIK